MQACETQLKLLPVGLDNLNLIPEETRKAIYDASRRPPEGYEVRHPNKDQTDSNKEGPRSQVTFFIIHTFIEFHPSCLIRFINVDLLCCRFQNGVLEVLNSKP